jgi:N-acylglucosamine-6-phosphate 2-epimerase
MTQIKIHPSFEKLKGGLVVSCQAFPGEPLFGPEFIVAMARSAIQGGAVGLRINGPVDVAAIRQSVAPKHEYPIIGLFKHDLPGFAVRITPTLAHAEELARAGANIIALDATSRLHPERRDAAGLIQAVQSATGLPVLADISTVEEGLAAEEAGAEAVSTTLSGYTPYSPQQEAPDLNLIAALAEKLSIPVMAEGRISTPEQAHNALAAGAFAVVVGSAITRPWWITEQFVKGIRSIR